MYSRFLPTRAFCLFFAILALHAGAEEFDLPKIVRDATPAVLQLIIYDAHGVERGQGTGFFISEDGRIVTNRHVLKGAARIDARLSNGASFPVQGALAFSTGHDLAILKVDAHGVSTLHPAADDQAEVGSHIAVIGGPLGLQDTVSDGIVSAHRTLEGNESWLQITAPISPGSSGSPVLNRAGEIVGVATMLMRGSQALNFAVPVQALRELMQELSPEAKPKAIPEMELLSTSQVSDDPDYRAARAAAERGDHPAALKLLKAAAERFPSSFEVKRLLTQVYFALNFFEDAVEAARAAIKERPEDAPAWNNLGASYFALHRHDLAAAAFQQAVKLDPASVLAWQNLARLYTTVGNRAGALHAAAEAKKAAASPQDRMSGEWKITKLDGRDYVSVQDLAAFYGMSEPVLKEERLVCTLGTRTLDFGRPPDDCRVNGLAFRLTCAPERAGGNWLISRMDLVKTLEPVLRPGKIKGLASVQTVVLDPVCSAGKTKGVAEKARDEAAFACAERTRALLAKAGFAVVLTRDTAAPVAQASRLKRITAARNAVVISFDFRLAAEAGSEIETLRLAPRGTPSGPGLAPRKSDLENLAGYKFDAASVALATALTASAATGLKTPAMVSYSREGILPSSPWPTVLLYLGSVAQPEERARWENAETHEQLGRALTSGLRRFLSVVVPGSLPPSPDAKPSPPEAGRGQ